MYFRLKLLSLAIITALLFSCQRSNNKAYQYSTIDMLLCGNYDGNSSLAEITKHGDFGIGTFNKLDGEMIVLDGIVYQARKDGAVSIPGNDVKTPFATVCYFNSTQQPIIDSAADFKALEADLIRQIDDNNIIYAVKIVGLFDSLALRTVVPQEKPYKPLVEVVKQQSVFSQIHAQGTLVGFLCPVSLGKVAVPGLHLHFISSDLKKAGHVLKLSFLGKVKCELTKITAIDLQLMTSADTKTTTTEADIEKVER